MKGNQNLYISNIVLKHSLLNKRCIGRKGKYGDCIKVLPIPIVNTVFTNIVKKLYLSVN